MSMNLNSLVEMLPQEVKTPLVPDNEMSSTIGSAEYKGKEASDVLAAPFAKKTATSDASKEVDGTETDEEGDLSDEEEVDGTETDEEGDLSDEEEVDGTEPDEEGDLSDEEEVDGPEPDEEGDLSDEERPRFLTPYNEDQIIRFTTDYGDYQAMSDALAKLHGHGSELYESRLGTGEGAQRGLEALAFIHCDCDISVVKTVKLRVEIVFSKGGAVGSADILQKI